MTRSLSAFFCFITVVLTGCAEGPKKKAVFPVHGRVTFNGKPVDKATILFSSVDTNNRSLQSHGATDGEGNYSLSTYLENDGAPLDEYIVTIVWPGGKKRSKGDSPDDGESPEPTISGDRLKGAYATVGVSKLRATVKAESDNEINFNLP